MLKFIVPGVPVAKGRARSFIKNGRVAHYTPKQTASYENLVRVIAAEEMADMLVYDGPVSLKVALYLPIPQSWSKKKITDAKNGQIKPTTKPDLSNTLKAVEDAMNGIVYFDDKQIVELSVSKIYSDCPRAEITVDVA